MIMQRSLYDFYNRMKLCKCELCQKEAEKIKKKLDEENAIYERFEKYKKRNKT